MAESRIRKEKLIVALDGMTREQALTFAWSVSSHVWGFKVNDLLLTYGAEIIQTLKCLGRVFADPKLYDIPKTVANSVARLSDAGADMITVHVSGGAQMMKAALEQSGNSKIIGVTIPTSTDGATCQQIYGKTTEETVWDLAHLASDVGLHGIVCSPKELKMLKHLNVIKITPGIRPFGAVEGEDQVRVQTKSELADFVVIGRPLTQSADPLETLRQLSE